jgi:hypothetical protein
MYEEAVIHDFNLLFHHLVQGTGRNHETLVLPAEIQNEYILNTPPHFILGNGILFLMTFFTYSRPTGTMAHVEDCRGFLITSEVKVKLSLCFN